jgi:hypothetical protein
VAEGSPGPESGATQSLTALPAHSYTRPKWTHDEDFDEEERAREIQELRQRSDEELKAEVKRCALQLGVTEEEYANLDPEAPDDAFNKAIARAEARILREDGPTPRCQHIKANGTPCGGYALKKKRFCFFHAQTADSLKKKKTKRPFHIPVLEDDLALQTAVTNICRGLANESLEPKRAATLLYGLQVASTVLKKKPAKKRTD